MRTALHGALVLVSIASVARGQSASDSASISGFLDRVDTYLQLRQKLESSAPALPRQATPEQIDQHQRALLAAIGTARRGVVAGSVFGADMTALIKRRFQAIFAGAQGAKLRKEILAEYPGPTPVAVNARYPDKVPLTNMPTVVLEQLPKLPDEIEFRFVGDQLILFDPHARLVIDFIRNALPGA